MKAMRIALCLSFIIVTGCLEARGGPPNVLLIVADDLGWGDLSANGNREVQTVNLDALGTSGLRFEKFYVCPNGSTTSVSLLTGRYHYRTGVVGESGLEAMMHASEKTLGEIFGENGYRTGFFGRWYHGENWPHNALSQGFSEFEAGEPLIAPALDFIKQDGAAPFFCLINLPDPALNEKESLSPQDRIKQVNQGVAKVDDAVGRLLETLDSIDQRKNTIVIFLSDNGPDQFGAKEGRYNGYFYGGKGSVHEGGVRVPCFVSWPGMIEPGSRFGRISAHIDWYPTLAELCGLASQSRQLPLDGTSLATVLRGEWDRDHWPNRLLFTSWTPAGYAIPEASVAVRTDRWLALRDPNWRRHGNEWELYDLKTDPFESHEKGAEYTYLLSDLKADLSFWLDNTTDDGIGPIAIQIGHPEWPTVTFQSNPEMTWPVKVVTAGEYEIKWSGAKQCEMLIGGEKKKVGNGTRHQLNQTVKTLKIISGKVSGLQLSAQ